MATKTQIKTAQRVSRHKRIRARVAGTADKPRLAVFKSNTALYAQLVNDDKGHTITAADTRTMDGKTMEEKSVALGTAIAKKAGEAKIDTIVFDRGGYRYQGIIAAFADAARKEGLKF